MCPLDVRSCGGHLLAGIDCSRRGPFGVPPSGLFYFPKDLVEKFKRADHGERLPDSGDGLLTRTKAPQSSDLYGPDCVGFPRHL